MDLTRSIIYRGFQLNDPTLQNLASGALGDGVYGSTVDTWEWTVDTVQYAEKRALADGLDVGIPYLGQRTLMLTGTLYGRTRAEFFDNLANLQAALSPTLSYKEVPGTFGYQSLFFAVPTNRIAVYPTGEIDLQILAMPKAPPIFKFNRQKHGGEDGDPLACTWGCTFLCADPRVFSEVPVDTTVGTSSGPHSYSGTITNRGTYFTPLNALIVIGTGAITLTWTVGNSVMIWTLPSSANDGRILRYSGSDKILTLTELGVQTTRMDLLTFGSGTTHPLIAGGSSPYSLVTAGASASVEASSHFWFDEVYAE